MTAAQPSKLDSEQRVQTAYRASGLRVPRVFTREGVDPFSQFSYALRSSTIRNTDGSVVFELKDIEVPANWSQVATDILAQKYFRKAGVPQVDAEGKPVLGPTARNCWAASAR